MNSYCVYHFIHATTPYRYIPRLVIDDVPVEHGPDKQLIERAGYNFSEFGIPWANHGIMRLDPQESPADLVGAIRRGEVERITYDELVALAESPL